MKAKTISSGRVLRVLSTLIIAGALSTQVMSGQWLSGWAHRVPITIDNSTGEVLNEFQVKVTITPSSLANVDPDGSDIRFTRPDGQTTMPFWVETWDYDNEATFWVKVHQLNVGTTTIYMYYDNPTAENASNGFATFEFFDDFEEETINSYRWSASGGTWDTAQVVQPNGIKGGVAQGYVSSSGDNQALLSLGYTGSNYIAEVSGIQRLGNCWGLCTRATAINNYYLGCLYDNHDGASDYNLYLYEWNPSTHPWWRAYLGVINPNVWYKMTTKVISNATYNTVQVYINDEQRININDPNYTRHPSGGVGLYVQGTARAQFNDLRVRKYAASEPSVASIGAEENMPTLNIEYTKSDVTCNGGSNGSITVTVTNGTAPYTYLWTPGGMDSPYVENLEAGTYTVQVTDYEGGIGYQTVEVLQPSQVIPEYSVSNQPVCADGLATVTISASGGTPPYVSGTGTFSQAVGTTEYTITDANGCNISFPITVSLAGAWFNGSWKHRIPVEVSNPGGAVLNDYQVEVILADEFDFTMLNSDGSDIRFTAYDGTEIPYWIESLNYEANYAVIWVKVPVIPVDGTTIYMYYGNSEAASASNGSATFILFDDFESGSTTIGEWSGYVAHDWKYSMEMQHGALNYAIARSTKGWLTESLDSEIEAELNYMHSQINPDGTITGLSSEPQYCYGLAMSNLSLGYLYFETTNPTLATQCYNDLILLFDRLLSIYPTADINDAGGYGFLLLGFSDAWKAFTHNDNDLTRAGYASTRAQTYAATFLDNQFASGAWNGADGVQEHLKRNFGMLTAADLVTGITKESYLSAVADNVDYILNTFWISSNGGLEWYSNPASSDHFYECHQIWFMTAIRLLYNASGGTYNYISQGQAAWRFLTDNNYANIDMYVHNYVNHGAFFSYRQITSAGVIQVDPWKGSYEIGTALWGMSLNYDWTYISEYQSSHSSQEYDYLDMMVKQIKKTTDEDGYFTSSGNWARTLNWNPSSYQPDTEIWTMVGSPITSLVEVEGNKVISITGRSSHSDHFVSVDNSIDNFVFESEVLMTADNNGSADTEIGFHYIDLNNRYFTQMRGTGVNDLYLRRYELGAQYVNYSRPYDYTEDVFFNYKMVINGNDINLLINDTEVTDYTDNGNVLSGSIYIGNYGTSPVYYDNVRIREYAAVEPVATISGEETAFSWTGCESTSVWGTGGNWYAGVAPGDEDDVLIPLSEYYPEISGSVICGNLTIDPGARLTVNADGVLTTTKVTINSEGPGTNGSLVNLGTVTGTVTYNRYLLPKDSGGDYQLASSPVETNSSANTNDIVRAKAWDEINGVWVNESILDVSRGIGYNLKQTETGDGIVSFTGNLVADDEFTINATSPFASPHDGTLSDDQREFVPESPSSHSGTLRDNGENWGGGGWNLLGNPFASAMSLTAFIEANTDDLDVTNSEFDPSHVALYLHDGSSYQGETPTYKFVGRSDDGWSGDDYLGEQNIQAGQGFFVLAMDDWSSFTFTKSMQVHDVEVPMLKSANTDDKWPGLRLILRAGSVERSTLIVYGENMTAGLDPGYDIGKFSSYSEIGLYTTLAAKDNGVNFARQALPLADYSKNIIPVGVDAEKGGEVTFSALTIPIGSYKFWLEDRLTGIYTDLTTKSYTVTLPADSWGTGRFYIIASTNTPTGIENPYIDDTVVRIWISNSKLIIKGAVSDKAVCEVYDVRGQKVIETRLVNDEMNTITLPPGMHGVYLVRLTDGPKVTTHKVAVL